MTGCDQHTVAVVKLQEEFLRDVTVFLAGWGSYSLLQTCLSRHD